MTQSSTSPALLNEIIDRISVGIFVVNKDFEIVLWNRYMENYSQKKSAQVLGHNLFGLFPDLPESWLKQKIRNVFIIKNFSFTSWEHRPYLFKFMHNRPITGGVDYMRQNCIFSPIKNENGEIENVCVTIMDVTDTSIYEGMLKNAVRSLAEASNRDGLTNVYNRRFLEQSMSKEFARIKRYGGTLSFIIIDLDHFKQINDNYGHLAGDEILKITSEKITECLRKIDVLARYGGEEFAVLLPETPLQGAEILAKRLCEHISQQKIEFDDTHIPVTASLGVAEFNDALESHEQLIHRADKALYKSKENGRNQVTLYSQELEIERSKKNSTSHSKPTINHDEAQSTDDTIENSQIISIDQTSNLNNQEDNSSPESYVSQTELEEITNSITTQKSEVENAEEIPSEQEPNESLSYNGESLGKAEHESENDGDTGEVNACVAASLAEMIHEQEINNEVQQPEHEVISDEALAIATENNKNQEKNAEKVIYVTVGS